MTKREILKFLEIKRNEKLSSIHSDYKTLRGQLMQKAYTDLELNTLAGQIQPLLSDACRLWNDWVKKNENLDYVSIHHSTYNMSGLLNRYTAYDGATLVNLVKDDINVEPDEVKNAYQEYKANRDCVMNTYTTVYVTVQEMKNAKQAAVYLNELGFDLSEIGKPAEPEQTALMVPVDTRFLFVKAA